MGTRPGCDVCRSKGCSLHRGLHLRIHIDDGLARQVHDTSYRPSTDHVVIQVRINVW